MCVEARAQPEIILFFKACTSMIGFLLRPKEGIEFLESWSSRKFRTIQRGCWELNSSLWQEQQVLLTSESSLQSPLWFLVCFGIWVVFICFIFVCDTVPYWDQGLVLADAARLASRQTGKSAWLHLPGFGMTNTHHHA